MPYLGKKEFLRRPGLALPFSKWRVLQLDHLDAEHVAVVVDILQLGDHLVARPAVRLVEEDGEILDLGERRMTT